MSKPLEIYTHNGKTYDTKTLPSNIVWGKKIEKNENLQPKIIGYADCYTLPELTGIRLPSLYWDLMPVPEMLTTGKWVFLYTQSTKEDKEKGILNGILVLADGNFVKEQIFRRSVVALGFNGEQTQRFFTETMVSYAVERADNLKMLELHQTIEMLKAKHGVSEEKAKEIAALITEKTSNSKTKAKIAVAA